MTAHSKELKCYTVEYSAVMKLVEKRVFLTKIRCTTKPVSHQINLHKHCPLPPLLYLVHIQIITPYPH